MPSCPEDDPVPDSAPLPPGLQRIVDFFVSLPEAEKVDNLILYADAARKCEPRAGETFALEDIRKDEECADTVGIFLKVDPANQHSAFRVTLGPEVQTLTKAMTSILCKGLEGLTPLEVQEVPSTFVPQIVGTHLVRIRSQTTYYVLSRMKSACKVYLDRRRAAAVS